MPIDRSSRSPTAIACFPLNPPINSKSISHPPIPIVTRRSQMMIPASWKHAQSSFHLHPPLRPSHLPPHRHLVKSIRSNSSLLAIRSLSLLFSTRMYAHVRQLKSLLIRGFQRVSHLRSLHYAGLFPLLSPLSLLCDLLRSCASATMSTSVLRARASRSTVTLSISQVSFLA